MNALLLLSPAKLNLYLRVLNRREDGYHDLVTLFERIDLCDTLRFRTNRDGRIRIECDDPDVPCGRKNLVYRAAIMLKEECALADGVDVRIKKRIPVAAGLGGGSSNAACALMALNRLWKLSLSHAQLLEYGRALGSDVPFFLFDCSWALGTGRGDAIRPLKLPLKLDHFLVVPRVKVYSSQAFSDVKLQLTKQNDDVNILIRALRREDRIFCGRLLRNDLETAIIRSRPRLSGLKNRMKALANEGVSFSGSGPAIFGIARSRKTAEQNAKKLSHHYKRVFVVKTL